LLALGEGEKEVEGLREGVSVRPMDPVGVLVCVRETEGGGLEEPPPPTAVVKLGKKCVGVWVEEGVLR